MRHKGKILSDIELGTEDIAFKPTRDHDGYFLQFNSNTIHTMNNSLVFTANEDMDALCEGHNLHLVAYID